MADGQVERPIVTCCGWDKLSPDTKRSLVKAVDALERAVRSGWFDDNLTDFARARELAKRKPHG